MSENAKYLVAYIYKNDYKLTYEEVINSLKIERGSVAKPYSPYRNG